MMNHKKPSSLPCVLSGLLDPVLSAVLEDRERFRILTSRAQGEKAGELKRKKTRPRAKKRKRIEVNDEWHCHHLLNYLFLSARSN
jgi:hypothetical protein